ncbi:uncharacterized protein SOCE26_100750 [Sorangium cellulosum]|uniref:DUF2169 domain-containing protein n=1 Tax=Sorangium cellulosum TaxID=56 RepID=A0A2L0FAL3_SORCE|nr:DUF2169 domain-containing protein [Sorangium cellulosum]AUX48537.1 uncharacterized protein SOCE26_100750 [Sorangium cellulosum]
MANQLAAPPTVTPLRGAAAASVAWRSRGELRVTVIVKATFAFAPDADMPRIEPQRILQGEVHHGNNPARSVRFTSDLAPHLDRADVLFTGHAHAPPPGTPVQSLPVRLAISDEGRVLLDKQLLVQDKAGFQRMPIVYERALRGEDDQENFLGVPAAGDDSAPEANVVDPLQPARPAGFGPIARAWPARKRLLGATPRKALDAPIAEIPDAFEWAYFQAAPPDQRIDPLRGGEWIELDGLHPALPRLRTRLPDARGLARLHGLSAFGVSEGQLLDLTADTLRIDGDEQRCTVVFRGSFPVPDEAALAAARIVAGVEILGEPLAWPEAPPPQGAAAHGGGAGLAALGLAAAQTQPALAASTLSLPGSNVTTAALPWTAAAPAPATPFRAGAAPADLAGHGAGAQAPRQDTGTLAISPDDGEGPGGTPAATLALMPEQDHVAADQPPLPFQPAAPGEAPALARSARAPFVDEERRSSGTLALPAEDGWESSDGAPASARPSGSPGAEAFAGGAEPARDRLDPAEVHVDVAPAALPEEPPPPPRVAFSASPRAPETDVPIAAAPPPRPPPPPALPAMPTPSPSLRRSLYERFDRKR